MQAIYQVFWALGSGSGILWVMGKGWSGGRSRTSQFEEWELLDPSLGNREVTTITAGL